MCIFVYTFIFLIAISCNGKNENLYICIIYLENLDLYEVKQLKKLFANA